MTQKLFALSMLISLQMAPAEFRVVGYIPDYDDANMAKIDFSVLTHVNAAFVNPDGTGSFSASSGIQSIIQTSKTHANVKALISIGGANADSTTWSTLVMDASHRLSAVSQLMQMAKSLNADGIDVDLEGGLFTDPGYGPFVKTLYDSTRTHQLLLTAALASWEDDGTADSTINRFDFINLMAYDDTGDWDSTAVGQHSPYSAATRELKYYTATPYTYTKANAVLGLPFYGYDFANYKNQLGSTVSTFTWNDIVANHPEAMNVDSVVNATEKKYYNGKLTIRKKTALAAGYGGVMIWELGQDSYDTNSLLTVVKKTVDSLSQNGILGTQSAPISFAQIVFGSDGIWIEPMGHTALRWQLNNIQGQNLAQGLAVSGSKAMVLMRPQSGLYFLRLESSGQIQHQSIMVP